MARALRVRLIKIKQDINAATHRLGLEQAQVETQQAELETKRFELEQQHLSMEAQMARATRYGESHAGESILTCVRCFVIHGVLQNMMPAESSIGGVNLYKCPLCEETIDRDGLP